jgi:hypothetical protein
MSTKSKEFIALRALLVGAALAGIASGTSANAAGLAGAFHAHAPAGAFTPVHGTPATPGTPASALGYHGSGPRACRRSCRQVCRTCRRAS